MAGPTDNITIPDVTDPDQALLLLHQSLASNAVDATNDAAIRMTDATSMIAQGPVQKKEEVKRILTSDTFDETYNRIVAPDGSQYMGTFPAGSKTSGSSNAIEIVQPDGSIQVFKKKKETTSTSMSSSEPKRFTPPEAVIRASFDVASNPDKQTFDVDAELQKLDLIVSPQEKQAALRTLSSNIDVRITEAQQRLIQQAGIQSGFTAAQQAVQNNMAQDNLPDPKWGGLSFLQRFGTASGQTQQAQEFLNVTRTTMEALHKTMMLSDAPMSKLLSAKNEINKHEHTNIQRLLSAEARTESRTANREAMAEEKLARVVAAVPAGTIANWKLASGNPDMEDSKAAEEFQRATKDKKDPKAEAAMLVNDKTAAAAILNDNLAVRQESFDLVIKHDKINNKSGAALISEALIKNFIKDPAKIFDSLPNAPNASEIAQTKQQYNAGNATQKHEIMKTKGAEYLSQYIEGQYRTRLSDLTTWNVPADSPLGQAIKKVGESNWRKNPAGQNVPVAYIAPVMDTFINDLSIVGPDKKPLPYEARLAMLTDGLANAVNNESTTILYPNLNPLHIVVTNLIQNAAARAYARGKQSTIDVPAYHGGNPIRLRGNI